jgi:hypothetical protein
MILLYIIMIEQAAEKRRLGRRPESYGAFQRSTLLNRRPDACVATPLPIH